MSNSIKAIIWFVAIVVVLLVGVAIPKQTVRDIVSIDGDTRAKVMQAVADHYNSPLERLALRLGQSRVVEVSELSTVVETYTIFRIPLGFFSGASDMKLSINFNSESNQPAEGNQENTEVNQENNPSWLTAVNEDQSIEFQYPASLNANYISTVNWPPMVKVREGKQLVCQETPAESSLPARTMRKQINGREYCVSASSEGAAGSVYTEYSYTTVRNEKIAELSFTLQYPQCYNYDDPKQSECQTERETYDLDALVGNMFASFKDLGNANSLTN